MFSHVLPTLVLFQDWGHLTVIVLLVHVDLHQPILKSTLWPINNFDRFQYELLALMNTMFIKNWLSHGEEA